jgi:small subunit ribosomal protein S5
MSGDILKNKDQVTIENEETLVEKELTDQVDNQITTTNEVSEEQIEQKLVDKELTDQVEDAIVTTAIANEEIIEQKMVDKELGDDKKTSTNTQQVRAKNINRGPRSLIPGFEEKIIETKKINKTSKGGRRMRFSSIAVVGNRKGVVGCGKGKSIEVVESIRKAIQDAYNHRCDLKISPKGSIYHEITCRSGATSILVKPAPVGTGIIAGGVIRAILDLAGYKNICCKKLGANSTFNMIDATLKCLKNQYSRKEIANLRNIKENEV